MMSFLLCTGHVVIFIVIWSWGHFYCDLVMLSLFLFFFISWNSLSQHWGLPASLFSVNVVFFSFKSAKLFLSQGSGLWCLQVNDQFSEPLLSSLQFKIMIGSQNHFCHCCRSKSTMLPCSYSSRCILTVHFPKKAKNQYSFVFCSFLWLLNLEPLNERYATEQQHKACMYLGLWVCTVPIFFKNKKYFLPLAPTSLFCASAAKLA